MPALEPNPRPFSTWDPDPPRTQAPSISDFVPGLIPLAQTSTPIDHLRARVESILTVFDDPRCTYLDIPDWARRATSVHPGFFKRQFTVRNLISAMRDSAASLGLADGERYVLEAVCTCAEDANKCNAVEHSVLNPPGSREILARGLQRLANAWVAFLLWPCKCSPSAPLYRTGAFRHPG